MLPKALLIEACDFERFPKGGQLSFACQMIEVFGERLALVGVSTDATPVGQWILKDIRGKRFNFFGLGSEDPAITKPLVPRRIKFFMRLKRYRKEILSLGIDCAFIQAQEAMVAVGDWGLRDVCYRFPGTENPIEASRYRWGRLCAAYFESRLFDALRKGAHVILASADDQAIEQLRDRSKGRLEGRSIIRFPTRVDTGLFHVNRDTWPTSESTDSPVFITCGRLNSVKGWDLLISAFALVKKRVPNATLRFVGDGEDSNALMAYARAHNLSESIEVTGFRTPEEVCKYLNTANVYLVGSKYEGWSVAVLEAMACGLPVVSTRVSGICDVVQNEVNGYIIDSRDPDDYAGGMLKALQMKCPNEASIATARKYSLATLRADLAAIWRPLDDEEVRNGSAR